MDNMRYTIVSKDSEKSQQASKYLSSKLSFLCKDDITPELIICVGGDGTILHAVHKYMDLIDNVKFVGIHTGTLGFFTDYIYDEIDNFIEDLKKMQYEIYESHLLEFMYNNNKYYALNEIRIENIVRTQTLDIYIDEEYFETVNGSGLCISTQAGSTAVNRALKGAVVDDGMQVLQMCEITGIHHHLSHSLGNPYIMKYNRKITVKSSNFENAYLCYDNKHFMLDRNSVIRCTTSNKTVKFARFKTYSYLKRLKNLY